MGQISIPIPVTGQPNSTEDVKIASALTTIETWANGNVDATNLTAGLAQSAIVNQVAQTVKGTSNIGASETRTNTAFGLMPTPDQVTGIVLPTNGLIAVWYQATWQSSVGAAGQAAIFIGTNQLSVVNGSASGSPVTQNASMGASAATNASLSTFWGGLTSAQPAGGYTGDVTTGQAVGAESTGAIYGGPCYVFAAAGTYAVSVQFKASSGSVTASSRKLWVMALSFV